MAVSVTPCIASETEHYLKRRPALLLAIIVNLNITDIFEKTKIATVDFVQQVAIILNLPVKNFF